MRARRLTQYQDKLDELGVDTLGVLRSLGDDDVDEIIKECDMKLGHKGLFKNLVQQEREAAADEKEMKDAKKEAAKAAAAADPAAALAGAAINAQMGGNLDPAAQAMLGGLAAGAAKGQLTDLSEIKPTPWRFEP